MDHKKGRNLNRPGCFYREKANSGLVKKLIVQKHNRARQRIKLVLANAKFARATWGPIPRTALNTLATLTKSHGLSVAAGDIQLLDGRWYVTHSGLLRIAERRHCFGIRTKLQKDLVNAANNRWIFRATIYKTPGSKGFVGYGDADPSNTSPLVRGAEMRVAETRAVNRALRKAYGIGLCSVEELGWLTGCPSSTKEQTHSAKPPRQN